MMKNESGRSMVEMLGVLAIIGVLSVGGIAGYTMAMKKYRTNEVLNSISMASIACQTNGNVNGLTFKYFATDPACDATDGSKGKVTFAVGTDVDGATINSQLDAFGTVTGGNTPTAFQPD